MLLINAILALLYLERARASSDDYGRETTLGARGGVVDVGLVSPWDATPAEMAAATETSNHLYLDTLQGRDSPVAAEHNETHSAASAYGAFDSFHRQHRRTCHHKKGKKAGTKTAPVVVEDESSSSSSSSVDIEIGAGSGSGSAPKSHSPWKLVTKHQGKTFFNGWNFWAAEDPTHGLVDYQSREDATSKGLAYVDGQGNAIMQVDSWTNLAEHVKRPSVRVHSKKTYNDGLAIVDVNSMPYGCAVWGAWWMNGPDWPNGGEIDIIEGVNDGPVNQYTLHTSKGCSLSESGNFTGRKISDSCYALAHKNAGCAIKDTNVHGPSYGSALNAHGGGVWATQFDKSGVTIWFFPRDMIPDDVRTSQPNPSKWAGMGIQPSAQYRSDTCEFSKYFYQQILIFDITLCGDWGAGAYAQGGCAGTCSQRVMKGSHFVTAAWNISSVKVYQQNLS